jgi:hypothetical protein
MGGAARILAHGGLSGAVGSEPSLPFRVQALGARYKQLFDYSCKHSHGMSFWKSWV